MDQNNQVALDPTLEEESAMSAEKLQQFYFECFGDRDWNEYNDHEHIFLKRNIGYAIFGMPNEINDLNLQDAKTTGYNKKQNKQIDEIYKAIILHHYLENSVILIRMIFVCCERKNKNKTVIVEPVFVLKKCHNERDVSTDENCKIYIDSCARVYNTWELYLEDNKLPKCRMVYPKNGRYQGEIIDNEEETISVILETNNSPACKIGKKVLEGTDTAGTVVSVGTTLTIVAAAIPGIAVAPALLTASAIGGIGVGIYSIGRSIQTLVDRKKHKQSIGLGNSESRSCWLNTGVGILGASASAASGLLTRAVSKGVEISKTAQIAFNTISTANVLGSATNFAFCSYNIVEKLVNKESISKLEIFQWASSALFFHNSISSFKTANTMISETQSQILLDYEQLLRSNRHRRLFRKAQLESRRLNGEVAGNAEVIVGIRNIHDPDNFFGGLARINKNFNQNGARYTITSDGKIKINSNYIVDPMEFASISKENRANILQNLPTYAKTPKSNTITTQASFNAKRSFISTACKNILLHPKVVNKIIHDLMNNELDLDTMTFIFKDFAEDIINMFMKILVKFLEEIRDSLTDFKKIFPMVSFIIGASQYLIHFVQNLMIEQKNSSLRQILLFALTCDKQFLKDLSTSFKNWIQQQIKMFYGIGNGEFNEINRIKVKKECVSCAGYYYESVKINSKF